MPEASWRRFSKRLAGLRAWSTSSVSPSGPVVLGAELGPEPGRCGRSERQVLLGAVMDVAFDLPAGGRLRCDDARSGCGQLASLGADLVKAAT